MIKSPFFNILSRDRVLLLLNVFSIFVIAAVFQMLPVTSVKADVADSDLTDQGNCKDSDGWTKIDSGDLSDYPVTGATKYCFKAGPYTTDSIPDGGFGQDGACAEGKIQNCGLSHWSYFVSGENLRVSKTVETSFDRIHKWSIEKLVNPASFNLKKDGSGDGTATWTVSIGYLGSEDSNWNVSGTITVENNGDTDVVITDIQDQLAGAEIDLNCDVDFSYTLAKDETLLCTYDEDGYVTGSNKVKVITERDTYKITEDISWGDPSEEKNKTITVKDNSDLLGERSLGTATAPNDKEFIYTYDFKWEDYADDCTNTQYDNVATIVETEQSDDALVEIICPEENGEEKPTPTPTNTPTPTEEPEEEPEEEEQEEEEKNESEEATAVGAPEEGQIAGVTSEPEASARQQILGAASYAETGVFDEHLYTITAIMGSISGAGSLLLKKKDEK